MKEEDVDISRIAGTPVENEVTLLYELANTMDILLNDIDNQLGKVGHGFSGEKKMQFRQYAQAVKNATFYLDKIGLDRVLWKATNENFDAYDNTLADSFEMIRFLMLYIDRSHSEEGYEAIYRFMSNLPKMGIFPDGYMSRFDFARPYIYGSGDRVMTEFGEAEIMAPGNNDNWVVKLKEDGKQVVVNKDTIKLL